VSPAVGAYATVFGVATAVTFLLTFLTRRLAIRFGAVVMPDEHRIHKRPLPTSGASLFLGFLAAMAVASRIDSFGAVFEGSSEPLAIVLAGSVMFAVGMLDDLLEVSPPAKMAGIVFSGSVLSLLGVVMIFLRIPFLDLVGISPDLAPLVTVIWVAGMANAINFIDGLDGLAAGIVAIAAGAFFLYTLQIGPENAGLLSETSVGPLVAVIACGICIGFLPHNFHPARIQMGDAGALFLGLLMAATTLVVGGRTDQPFSGQTYFFYAPIFIPFFILGVPILDTAFAIVRRTGRAGASVRDKGHLHYRLLFMGHGQRRSVAILWAWTALLSGLVLFPTYTNRGNAVIPFLVLALGVLLYTFFHPGVRTKNGAGEVLSTGDDAST
jgi:UDP-GlcNAc:undecaprenyl-phosphate/decaprenyl-phosphate GlcNAc-1-phosphate transferase